jgi:hypothetical protein
MGHCVGIWDANSGCRRRGSPIATGSYAHGFTWQCDKVSIPCVLRRYKDRVGRLGCGTEVVRGGRFVFTKRTEGLGPFAVSPIRCLHRVTDHTMGC